MTKKQCPLGDACDLTTAWMAGAARAKDRIMELEAKLAKARGALHEIAGKRDFADDTWSIARTTLAELTGGKDD